MLNSIFKQIGLCRYMFDDHRINPFQNGKGSKSIVFLLLNYSFIICEFFKQNLNNFFLDFFVLAMKFWLLKRENDSATAQECDIQHLSARIDSEYSLLTRYNDGTFAARYDFVVSIY